MLLPQLTELRRNLLQRLHPLLHGGVLWRTRIVAAKAGEDLRCLRLPFHQPLIELGIGKQHPQHIALIRRAIANRE
ncbi:hypothetical protein D3C71_1804510 [compost metagenome]